MIRAQFMRFPRTPDLTTACSICVIFFGTFPCAVVRQETNQQGSPDARMEEMRNWATSLAVEAKDSDSTFLGKKRFAIHPDDQTLSYDLTPIPLKHVLSETDPLAVPLEAMIRAEALRRDFQASIPDEKFWIAPIESVEKRALGCIASVMAKQNYGTSAPMQEECSKQLAQQFADVKQAIVGYATAHGLTPIATAQGRDPTAGYQVQIKIDPPRARVRVMTVLEYKKCIYFKTPLEEQWIDLLGGEQEMIGRYRYRAEWPADLGGPEEGTFEIQKAGALTFRPKQN